jgi:hypothetical protein
MNVLVPPWFFGLDSVMYLLSAAIGFLVSFNAFKLYSITSKKSHFYLYASFAVLGMGLLVLGVTTVFSISVSSASFFADTVSWVDDFGFWIYYASSLFAYGLLAMMYLPEKLKFPIFLPFWNIGFPYFQVLSIFLISYVIFKSASNYMLNKNSNALLVMAAFILMGAYHLLSLFTSLNEIMYVLAQISLLSGFVSLLIMLTRVNKVEC